MSGNKIILQQKKGMVLEEYEEIIGRLTSRKEVRGVAVTTPGGKMILFNSGISDEMMEVYIEVVNRIEYLCTVAARENDPTSRWEYVRIETDDYEMIIAIEPTHWFFTYADAPDTYNGEHEGEAPEELLLPMSTTEPPPSTAVTN